MKRSLKVIANWKMHMTVEETINFFERLSLLVSLDESDVCIAPAFTSIYPLAQAARGTNLKVGSQNVSDHISGAFTGEVSAHMVKHAGGSFSLVGHSERRSHYHENSELISKKILRCLESFLTPILCIGETELEKNKNLTDNVLTSQLEQGLKSLSPNDIDKLMIAYEPVWAIGSGNVPSSEVIQNIHLSCRNFLEKKYGHEVASKIKILYGGSVSEKTIQSLLSHNDIDGVLVGKAALSPDDFANIIKLSRELKK